MCLEKRGVIVWCPDNFGISVRIKIGIRSYLRSQGDSQEKSSSPMLKAFHSIKYQPLHNLLT